MNVEHYIYSNFLLFLLIEFFLFLKEYILDNILSFLLFLALILEFNKFILNVFSKDINHFTFLCLFVLFLLKVHELTVEEYILLDLELTPL